MTQEAYYNDESQWGSGQFITLKQVVDNYLGSRSDDDYTKNDGQNVVLFHARQGVKHLYYDVLKEFKAIRLELSPRLSVPMPPDCVSVLRVSWIDEQGCLVPIHEDRGSSIAKDYLQDNNYELLFDNDGCVLEASGSKTNLNTNPSNSNNSYLNGLNRFGFQTSYTPNIDQRKAFPNGRMSINTSSGVINFGTEIQGKEVVIEYVSDGLESACGAGNEQEIRVHKYAEEALMSYIYKSLINNRRNVPAIEKRRAEKVFWRDRRLAKRRINGNNIFEIIKLFKGADRKIKE